MTFLQGDRATLDDALIIDGDKKNEEVIKGRFR